MSKPKTFLGTLTALWQRQRATVIILVTLMVWSLGLTVLGVAYSHGDPAPFRAQVRLYAGPAALLPFTLHEHRRYQIRVDVTAGDRGLAPLSLVFDGGRAFTVGSPTSGLNPTDPTLGQDVGPLPDSSAFGTVGSSFAHSFTLTPQKLGNARLVIIAYARLNPDGTVDLGSYAGSTVWDGVVVP